VRLGKASVTADVGDEERADLGGNICTVGQDLASLWRREPSRKLACVAPRTRGLRPVSRPKGLKCRG
jgi:hypothetical protein